MEATKQLLDTVLHSNSTQQLQLTTTQISALFGDSQTVVFLFAIIMGDPDPSARQLGCILLRRHLEGDIWEGINEDDRQIIKRDLTKSVVQEHDKKVTSSMIDLIGTLLRMENDDYWWQQILQIICNLCCSNLPQENESGSYILARLSEMIPEYFAKVMKDICDYFASALAFAAQTNCYNTPILMNVYDAMSSLAMHIDGDFAAETCYKQAVPILLQALYSMRGDAESFTLCLSVIERLADDADFILNDHIQLMIQFCSEIVTDDQLVEDVKANVFGVLEFIIDLKYKAILEQNLVDVIVRLAIYIMAKDVRRPDDWQYNFWNDGEGHNLYYSALRIIDTVSDKAEPILIINLIKKNLSECKQSGMCSDFGILRTYYCCLAVASERCSTEFKQHLDKFMAQIMLGLHPMNPLLRNPALYALRCFVTNLMPDMRKYAPICIKILVELINLNTPAYEQTGNINEIICLISSLNPFILIVRDYKFLDMPIVLNQILALMEKSKSNDMVLSCFSTISHVIGSARADIKEYFPAIMAKIQANLFPIENNGHVQVDANKLELGIEALDVLSNLMRFCDPEQYKPFLENTVAYTASLITDADNTKDIYSSLFNLVGCAAYVAGEDICVILPHILPGIFELIDVSKENNDDSDDELDDIAICCLDEEKEMAVIAVKDLALNAPKALLPHTEKLLGLLVKIMQARHRSESLISLTTKSVVALLSVFAKNKKDVLLSKYLKGVSIEFSRLAQTNTEGRVVINALQSSIDVLTEYKRKAIHTESVRKHLIATVMRIFKGTTGFQKICHNAFTDSEESYSEAEVEEVRKLALKLLAAFGKAAGAKQFQDYFERCFPELGLFFQKTNKSQKYASSLAVAFECCCDYIDVLDVLSGIYFANLFPIAAQGLTHPYSLVRENALRCIGRLVIHSKTTALPIFDQILQKISVYSSEYSAKDGYEALVGCLARITLVKVESPHVESSIQLILQNLPLNEFKEDYEVVFKCFGHVLDSNASIASTHFQQILMKTVESFHQCAMDEACTEAGKNLIRFMYMKDQEKFDRTVMSEPQSVQIIKALME